jgi:2-dehydro-3-deoxy-D-arabinonate dehydratase
MHLVRYVRAGQVGAGAEVGVEADGLVRPLPVGSLAELLRSSSAEIRSLCEEAAGGEGVPLSDVRLLPPVDGLTEVWAAGVTYERSSAARQEESVVADVYSRVYDATRPELFFKGVAWRAVGHEEPIGVREDSAIDVPEAEVALVLNRAGETVGVTICDDVSSRSIEGDNPLYLPQAKVYDGACALGPWIRPVWEVPDLYDLEVTVRVLADGAVRWEGATSTSLLHRRYDDLVDHLRRASRFPDGVVLSTGTGLVPELDLSLEPGDVVEVSVSEVGTLRNPVLPATAEAFAWLTTDPARRP